MSVNPNNKNMKLNNVHFLEVDNANPSKNATIQKASNKHGDSTNKISSVISYFPVESSISLKRDNYKIRRLSYEHDLKRSDDLLCCVTYLEPIAVVPNGYSQRKYSLS